MAELFRDKMEQISMSQELNKRIIASCRARKMQDSPGISTCLCKGSPSEERENLEKIEELLHELGRRAAHARPSSDWREGI
jgi:hypothetical protein